MQRGLFITFEGIDGCGKSTQLARLVARLRAGGADVTLVREPGGSPLGERVRDLLLDPQTGDIDPAAEALLYAASRAELVSTVIEPALAAGGIVVADRFVDSSMAYQGAGRGLGIDRVLDANALAIGATMPDVTLWMQVPTTVAGARRAATGEADDRIEAAGAAFLDRVAAAYEQLAARWPARIVAVDGTGTPDEVEQRIDAALAPSLAAAHVMIADRSPA